MARSRSRFPSFGATFANNNDGTYTLTGTAAQVQAELQALVFTPTLHEASDGSTVVTQFSIQVSDADAPLNTVTNSNSQLTVTATAPPVLNGANNLTPIPENVLVTADTGMLVSSLISGRTSDADGHPLGIAITSVDNSNGQWEYSTGSGWIPIYDAAAVPVGATSPYVAVSSTSALLLTPTDLVRFVPNANFFGSAAIQFQAWDQTVGVATAALDESFDPTALPGSGRFQHGKRDFDDSSCCPRNGHGRNAVANDQRRNGDQRLFRGLRHSAGRRRSERDAANLHRDDYATAFRRRHGCNSCERFVHQRLPRN